MLKVTNVQVSCFIPFLNCVIFFNLKNLLCRTPMDQVRDRVRALSSCCQQLGNFFFYGCESSQFANFDSPRHGYGNLNMMQIDSHFLLPQELPFPLSRSNGAIPTLRKMYSFFSHISVVFSLTLLFRVSQNFSRAFKTELSLKRSF
jgi:hypothetical protein